MAAINRSSTVYLWAWRLLMLLGLAGVVLFPKGTLVLWFADNRLPALDYFFRYTTWLGDGVVVAIVALLLLFWRVRPAILVAASGLLTLTVTQGLKHIVFADMLRPVAYFAKLDTTLEPVLGYTLKHFHSFPSGHTTAAFALYLTLAFSGAFRINTAWWLLPAVIAALSRVYVGQHFLVDVVAGAAIGTAIAWLVMWQLAPRLSAPRWDGPLWKAGHRASGKS